MFWAVLYSHTDPFVSCAGAPSWSCWFRSHCGVEAESKIPPPLHLQQLIGLLISLFSSLLCGLIVSLLTRCVEFTLCSPLLISHMTPREHGTLFFNFEQKIFLLIMWPQEWFLFCQLSFSHFWPAHDRLCCFWPACVSEYVAFCFNSANGLFVMS